MTTHETTRRFPRERPLSSPEGTTGWLSSHRRTVTIAGSVVVALVALALGTSLNLIVVGLLLICPLMMVAMMFGMRGMHGGPPARAGRESALEILGERYARGELTQDQYDRMRHELT